MQTFRSLELATVAAPEMSASFLLRLRADVLDFNSLYKKHIRALSLNDALQ